MYRAEFAGLRPEEPVVDGYNLYSLASADLAQITRTADYGPGGGGGLRLKAVETQSQAGERVWCVPHAVWEGGC